MPQLLFVGRFHNLVDNNMQRASRTTSGLRSQGMRDVDACTPRPPLPSRALPDSVRATLKAPRDVDPAAPYAVKAAAKPKVSAAKAPAPAAAAAKAASASKSKASAKAPAAAAAAAKLVAK